MTKIALKFQDILRESWLNKTFKIDTKTLKPQKKKKKKKKKNERKKERKRKTRTHKLLQSIINQPFTTFY